MLKKSIFFNRNFVQKSKFCSKTKIILKTQNYVEKIDFF